MFFNLLCRLTMKPEEVTQNDREKTKRVVYAVVYGVGRCLMKDRKFFDCLSAIHCFGHVAGKEKLAEILNIHPSHAKELTKSFLGNLGCCCSNLSCCCSNLSCCCSMCTYHYYASCKQGTHTLTALAKWGTQLQWTCVFFTLSQPSSQESKPSRTR